MPISEAKPRSGYRSCALSWFVVAFLAMGVGIMKIGTLYGIGIGPGDPELMTMKGARILETCRHIFVPRARIVAQSLAFSIAERYVKPGSQIIRIEFPMTRDPVDLEKHWEASSQQIAEVLETGEDACYLTLGDTMLYSTYVYLLRALRRRLPDVNIITVPGVNSVGAAAALAEFPLGIGDRSLTILPVTDDLDEIDRALCSHGTVVLMKIGKRLHRVLDLLEQRGLMENAVFVARAGLDGQQLVTDLRQLKNQPPEAGHMSIILIHCDKTDSERRL